MRRQSFTYIAATNKKTAKRMTAPGRSEMLARQDRHLVVGYIQRVGQGANERRPASPQDPQPINPTQLYRIIHTTSTRITPMNNRIDRNTADRKSCTIKTIAGEDSECVLATGQLAALVSCSRSKIANARTHQDYIDAVKKSRRLPA
jgi:hypothetical protein